MEIIIIPHTFQETIINPRALPYSNPGQRNDLIRNPRGSLQISVRSPSFAVKRNFAGKQSSTEMKLRYRININGGGQWISRCKCRECRCSRSCERTTIGIVFSFPTTTTTATIDPSIPKIYRHLQTFDEDDDDEWDCTHSVDPLRLLPG